MPAVPPYSSTTSTVCSPLARTWAITSSPSSVDGTTGTGDGQAGEAGPRPIVRRHLEDLFDVDQSDRLVQVALDDREARVAGLHRHHDQVGDVLVGLQRLDLGPRRHQLLGGSRPELQRAVHERRRDRIEGTAARGVAHQRAELLR